MTTATAARRAIGIVRVSQRDDDSGHSPEVQARAMIKQAQAADFTLTPEDIWDENVDTNGVVRPASGGALLADRPKLHTAVEEVERGRASVILAERFDRLFRDLDVQREVIRRVEAAGGRLVTAAGMISHATAEAELHANLNGAIAQYQKRSATERSFAAVEVAIEQGRVPWKSTTPGYDIGADGRLVPNAEAPVVEEAFRLRADGTPVRRVQEFLREHDIERSFHGVGHLLKSRVVLGEIHFGKHTANLSAHDPIVERDLWKRVQDVRLPRGPRAKSERLLARAGILRCASCGARMVVGTANRSQYFIYRCPPTGDCEARVTIAAEPIERHLTELFLSGVRDIIAKGTDIADVAELADATRKAQADLDAATRLALAAGVADRPSAVEQITALREAHEAAVAALDRARDADALPSLSLSLIDEWPDLSVDERRRLLVAGLERVEVRRGRAPVEERVLVRWRGSRG